MSANTDGQIKEVQDLQPEIVQLLEKVVWGTEGARYTLTDIEPTLRHLPNTSWITVTKGENVIGARLFIEKQAQSSGRSLHSFYHSFFAIDPAEKGKGYGKMLARETVESLRKKLGKRGLIYCHVEVDNQRSLAISESLGYQRVGQFHAMTFSRFFPSASPRLRKLTTAEKPQALRMLNELYADYAITDFSLSLQPESYFVLAEGDKLLAGVQVEPQRWRILSLAGFGSAAALLLLPHLPLLRDLFNPQNFQFLKAGNLFFQKDHPEHAFELLEAVLTHHHLKTAMMFWDKESPVFKQFSKAGSFGVLNALTETPVHILALFQGLGQAEIVEFRRRPKVISPIDI